MGELIYFKKNTAQLEQKKAYYDKKTNTFTYKVALPRAHGVILQPSFGVPSVIEEDDVLNVYMLINEDFQDGYNYTQKIKNFMGKDISQVFVRRINLQLRYNSWSNLKQQSGMSSKDLKKTNARLYDWDDINTSSPIATSKPRLIDKQDIYILDHKDRMVGYIPNKSIKHYLDEGLIYFIRISLKNHPLGLNNDSNSLYNISWMSIEDDNLKEPEHTTIRPFEERQDRIIKRELKKSGVDFNFGFDVSKEDLDFKPKDDLPILSYHPVFVTNKSKLGFGHLTDIHLSSRQELFKRSKLQVIPGAPHDVSPPIGQLVHTSFSSVKNLLDQMGENSDVDLLVLTGDLIDYSQNLDFNKIQSLDLEDHQISWELMSIKDKFNFTSKKEQSTDMEDTHSNGIDMILMYSLVKYYYDKYQKPIFLTSGNHDNYELPYGISPRLGNWATGSKKNVFSKLDLDKDIIGYENFDTKPDNDYDGYWSKLKKANEAIPLDHNLGVYEAILMYGPGYGAVKAAQNFNNIVGKIFYNIFSSVSDFVLVYKDQVVVGLDWGDDEAFLFNKIKGNSSLPRACASLYYGQLDILRSAKSIANYQKDYFLFCHAPIFNYDFDEPLAANNTTEYRTVICHNNSSGMFNNYDTGSFSRNKQYFCDKFLMSGVISHAFSGHSHRAGLYQALGYLDLFQSDLGKLSTYTGLLYYPKKPDGGKVYIRGISVPEDKDICLTQTYKLPFRKKVPKHINQNIYKRDTKMAVSGSAGSIAVRNDYGELGGRGLAPPSGSILTYKNNKESFRCVTAKNKTAKPRFAAFLDGFDILEGGPFSSGVFTKFEVNPKNHNEVIVETNPKLSYWDVESESLQPLDFVDFFEVYVVDDEQVNKFKMEKNCNALISSGSCKYYVKFNINLIQEINDIFSNNKSSKAFVSVKTRCMNINIYNYQYRWNYCLDYYILKSKLKFKRDGNCGEVPNFKDWESNNS